MGLINSSCLRCEGCNSSSCSLFHIKRNEITSCCNLMLFWKHSQVVISFLLKCSSQSSLLFALFQETLYFLLLSFYVHVRCINEKTGKGIEAESCLLWGKGISLQSLMLLFLLPWVSECPSYFISFL